MTTNLELARSISKNVDLETVVVRKADLDVGFDPQNLPVQLTLESGYRCTHEIKSSPEERTKIHVSIEFRFGSRLIVDDEPDQEVVDLKATFLLIYALREEMDLDPVALEHFAGVNGGYNAWPYWREFVQSAMGRAGLPGIVVPLFRPPVKELSGSEEKSDQ